jgi:histone-lysine N-methyltransferase MLL1
MFGVNHNAVVYLLEQLYGAQLCRNYKFRYQQYTRKEEEEVFNSCSF